MNLFRKNNPQIKTDVLVPPFEPVFTTPQPNEDGTFDFIPEKESNVDGSVPAELYSIHSKLKAGIPLGSPITQPYLRENFVLQNEAIKSFSENVSRTIEGLKTPVEPVTPSTENVEPSNN